MYIPTYKEVLHFALFFNGHHQPIVHDYPYLPLFVVPLYVLFVFYGPKLMEKREPFKLEFALKIWNFFLFFISLSMFLGLFTPILLFWTSRGFYELVCMPQGEMYYGFAFFCIWVFGLSKYLELFDTLFLILRKREVTFLHWYHHTTVLCYTWFSLVIMTPPGAIFGMINTFVHTIMYWYYFLAAKGKRPTWGKFVTIVQLSQMVLGVSITSSWAYNYLTGVYCPMGHPQAYMLSSLVLYGSYFLLFLQFYLNRYNYDSKGHYIKPADRAAAKDAKKAK